MRFKLASVAEFYISLLYEAQYVFKKNSDFISLCSHDRLILFRNTMKYVASFSACFIARYTHLLDNLAFYKSSEIIYGSNTLIVSNRVTDQFIFDSTFIKVILALLAFSTFDYTYNKNIAPVNLINFKAILRIQDMYTTLTWRYLIYKYGYEQAVICFSHLIRCLLLIDDALIEAVKSKQYTDMIDSIIKKTEKTFLLIK